MKLNRILSIFIIFSLFIIGCKKESDDDPNIAKLENDLEISDFIWKGLNQYYYWQESVINLADSKLDNLSEYSFYLSQNPNPENFFNSLKHSDDEFSWLSDDYEELENYLQVLYMKISLIQLVQYIVQEHHVLYSKQTNHFLN